MRNELSWGIGVISVWAFLFLVTMAGWITHVIHTIQNEEWLLLIAGAILAPIAVIHGIGLWFGFF